MSIRPDDYIIHLELKNKKKIKLEFSEATIDQTLDFLEFTSEREFSLIEFLYDFINKHGNEQMSKEEFQENVMMEFSDMLAMIKKTRFSGVFDKPEGEISEKTEKTPTDAKTNLKRIKKDLAKIIAYIGPKMSRDPKYIRKNYTWAEAIFWANEFIYQENEKTEEGRKRNKAIEVKENIEENKDFYDAEFAKLDLYLKKQNEGKKN